MPGKKGTPFLSSMLPDPRGSDAERKRQVFKPTALLDCIDEYFSFAGNIVALETGPTSQIFNVHEELLAEHSPFFQAAIKKEWIESQHRLIPLPDDDPDVVSLYVHWTYAGRILSRPSDPTSEEAPLEIDFLVNAPSSGRAQFHGQISYLRLQRLAFWCWQCWQVL